MSNVVQTKAKIGIMIQYRQTKPMNFAAQKQLPHLSTEIEVTENKVYSPVYFAGVM